MRAGIASVALTALLAACTESPGSAQPKPVAVTLKIDSNMTPWKDFDQFRLTIIQRGYEKDSRPYRNVALPAYYQIVPGAEKRPYVTVSLEGFLHDTPVGHPYEAQFYIPENYEEIVAQLWRDSESKHALGLGPQASSAPSAPKGGFRLDLIVDGLCAKNVFTEECAEGETCVGGRCLSSRIDITKLPAFGLDGDTGAAPAACQNVRDCFANSTPLGLGPGNCQFMSEAPAGMTNVAVVLGPDAAIGTCDAARCLLPLTYGPPPGSWIRAPGADGGLGQGTDGLIEIDEALCRSATEGSIRGFRGFVASGGCPTFSRNVTPCPEGAEDGGRDGPGGEPPGDGGTDGGGPGFVVNAVSPGPSAIDVSPTATISVSFSLALGSGRSEGSLTVSRDSKPIAGSVAVRGQDLVFTPAQPLALLTEYEVAVAESVVAADGTPLARAFSSTFTTRDGSWRQAEVVSSSPASSAQLAIGPSSEALVAFTVGRQLQSARWSTSAPTWTPAAIPGGLIVDSAFLLGSDLAWGAMAMAQDGSRVGVSTARYTWATESWDQAWPAAFTSPPALLDVRVHGGQGWALYLESSAPYIGSHGGLSLPILDAPAGVKAASLAADAAGGLTVIYGGPPTGTGALISAQTVSSSVQMGAVVEIGGDEKMTFEALRAVGDGTGNIDAFWIQQVMTPTRVSQVMTARRSSGVWSPPRELHRATGTFLNQLYVTSNGLATVLAWLDHHVTTSDGATGTPAVHVMTPASSVNTGATKLASPIEPDTLNHPKAALDPSGHGSLVWRTSLAIGTSRLGRTGTWSTPADIPGSGDAKEQPDVAFDADGRGWAVWADLNGVKASRFE